MRPLPLILVFGFSALTAGCDAVAQIQNALSSPADLAVSAQVATARVDLEQGDGQMAALAIAPAATPEVLATLSGPKRHEVMQLDAFALSLSRHFAEATAAFQDLTTHPFANADDRRGRLVNAAWSGDGAAADAALQAVLADGTPLGDVLSDAQLEDLDDTLGAAPDPRSARWRLAEALEAQGWRAQDPFADGQSIWLHYALALVEKGNPLAATVARRIDNPDLLITMQADRRFDTIIAAEPDRFDPLAAARRRLDKAQAIAAAEPARLSARMRLAQALIRLGQWKEADETVGVAGRDKPPPGFVDSPQYFIDARLLDGSIRSALGDPERELVWLGQVDQRCGCLPNRTLREAQLLLMLDRAGEAERTLLRLDAATLSMGQRMFAAYIKVCAASRLGKPAEASAERTFLRDHWRSSPEDALTGEVCAGDPDQSAAVIIDALRDPQRSEAALTGVQSSLGYPVEMPQRRRLQLKYAALVARPDVAAAIAAVGHLRRFPIQRMRYAS
ncbi:MAG TPA: hypothetical protein VG939_15400 [Caulobacteraceae bacterium]|nr:hypothetical protein [Caulobacteraceae bacterium]